MPARAATAPGDAVSAPDATIIGQSMRIKGDIISGGDLVINGEVEGRLESGCTLTVGPTGKARATMKAAEIIVSGAVNGNADAARRIVLRAGANLVGDVKTAGIVIEDGAFFKGGIDITRPEIAAS